MAWYDGLSREQVRQLLGMVEALGDQVSGAREPWERIARPEQLPPDGDWPVWLMLTGRAWGKTRAAAEAMVGWIREGRVHRAAVVGPTLGSVRDTAIAALRRAAGPYVLYTETRHMRLLFPNGAEVLGFSAEEPDSLRGFEFDAGWAEELVAWRYPEAFHQLRLAVRTGEGRIIVTTTPGPGQLLRDLYNDPSTRVTPGRTLDNAANLSGDVVRDLLARYNGTRRGRQELDGDLLADVPGAMWDLGLLDACRVATAPTLVRTVVAVDPAVTTGRASHETGIIVTGVDGADTAYVLADYSCRAGPATWPRMVIRALREHGAERVVVEVNQGGDLVAEAIRAVDPAARIRTVRASEGKLARAERVAGLYSQGRVHHVGSFPNLEDQMCAATPEGGHGPDDRLDALVWGLSDLCIPGSRLLTLGEIRQAYGSWKCVNCGKESPFRANGWCRGCGTLFPATYEEAVDFPGENVTGWT